MVEDMTAIANRVFIIKVSSLVMSFPKDETIMHLCDSIVNKITKDYCLFFIIYKKEAIASFLFTQTLSSFQKIVKMSS